MNDTRRTRVVLGVLLLISLAFITIDYRGGANSPLNALRSAGSTIFGPIENGVGDVTRPVAGAFDTLTGSVSAHSRIEGLEERNEQLSRQLSTDRLAGSQVTQLDRLLGAAGLGGYRVVAAQVVSASTGTEDTVAINAGSADGIRPNMTVMGGDGLIGRVTQVGPTTATVLLAIDPDSEVGGRLEATEEIGVAQGQGLGHPLRYQLLSSSATVRVGERLVTFGSMHDQPYVPGVPIGTVTTIERTPGALTRTALVRPFADFTALDVVGVVVGPPKSDPRDAVLPPKPPPTPVAKANAAAARPVKGAAAVKPKRTAPKPKPTKGG